jgi:hypothetical protein
MYVPTCGTNVIYLNAYLNHSTRPNMRTKDGYTFTTRRMIRRREELTVSDVWRRGSSERCSRRGRQVGTDARTCGESALKRVAADDRDVGETRCIGVAQPHNVDGG